MPGEGVACGTGGGVPQAEGFPTRTGEGGTIRTKHNALDTGPMSGEGC